MTNEKIEIQTGKYLFNQQCNTTIIIRYRKKLLREKKHENKPVQKYFFGINIMFFACQILKFKAKIKKRDCKAE